MNSGSCVYCVWMDERLDGKFWISKQGFIIWKSDFHPVNALVQTRNFCVWISSVPPFWFPKSPPLCISRWTSKRVSSDRLTPTWKRSSFDRSASQADPMTKLRKYIEDNNLRLVDFFNQFDEDNSMTVTRDEFQRGVEVRPTNQPERERESLLAQTLKNFMQK